MKAHTQPGARVRNAAVQAALVAAIAGAAWILWRRDEPERLLQVGSNDFVIARGMFYRPVARVGGGFQIVRRPVTGGAEAPFLHELPGYQLTRTPDGTPPLQCVESRLVYSIALPPKPPPPAPPVGRPAVSVPAVPPPQDRRPFLGTFAAGDGRSLQGGVKRHTFSGQYGPATPTLIRTIDLAGGSPKTAAVIPGLAAVGGQTVAWTRTAGRRYSFCNAEDARSRWQEQSGRGELEITSLADARSRTVHMAGPPGSRFVFDCGVFWTTLRPYPNAARDLFFATSGDLHERHLGVLDKADEVTCATLFSGRLYWIVRKPNSATPAVLCSAKPDGTDRRQLMPSRSIPFAPAAAFQGGQILRVVHGVLYGVFMPEYGAVGTTVGRGAASPGGQPGIRAPVVCRISPGRGAAPEVVRTLPSTAGEFQFDGRHLYFVLHEVDRSLLAKLTADEAGGMSVATLCRVALP